MFPFAAENMESFVAENWDALADVVADFRSLAQADRDAGNLEAIPIASESDSREDQAQSVVANALWQMSQDGNRPLSRRYRGEFGKGDSKAVICSRLFSRT